MTIIIPRLTILMASMLGPSTFNAVITYKNQLFI